MESWKPRMNHHKQSKAKAKNGATCRRHPKHNQAPGVCSICLTERLAKLANRTTSSCPRYYSSSSSSSSYLSYLSSSSSYSSPAEWETGRKSASIFKNIAAQDLLIKCKSSVLLLQRRKGKGDEKSGDDMCKRGFWSKLLRRKNKGLMHSSSTRERVIASAAD